MVMLAAMETLKIGAQMFTMAIIFTTSPLLVSANTDLASLDFFLMIKLKSDSSDLNIL
jgi:hypothetical protein